MGSWDDINISYWERIGDEITGNNSLKKQVEEITSGMNTPTEKLNALYSFVKNNILWDGSNRKYPTITIKKVLDEKKGNSAEVNLLLASMLEKAGIPVFAVLLSTRDHGFVREAIQVSSQFNYVACLAKIDDKSILLDATNKLLPIGMLPENCLNGNGLMVSKDGFQWIKLQTSLKTRTVINVDASLTENADLKGVIRIDKTGYHSVASRATYLAKGEAAYLKDFVGSHSWDILKSEFQNVKEIQQPFKEIYNLVISEHIASAGNTYYLNPFILDQSQQNPFKQEKRDYPVDFGTPFDKTYMFKIALPVDYLVEELPKSKIVALPNNAAKYVYNVSQAGNIINITSSLTIGRSIFSQDEYIHLQEFYNQIIAKQAEQIVIKKK